MRFSVRFTTGFEEDGRFTARSRIPGYQGLFGPLGGRYEGSNAQQIPQFTSVLLGLITKRLLQLEEVASRFFDLTRSPKQTHCAP